MHPTDEQLIDHLDGRRADRTRRHLEEGCLRCSRRLESVRTLLTTMRTDRDADPPAAWVARAIALRAPKLLDVVRERVLGWIGDRREELAEMISDSLSGSGELALAGIRAAGGPRRLRFESASTELDLQIEPEIDATIVTGQFVTTAPEPSPVANARFLLVCGSRDLIEGTTDRLGEFSVEAPQEGELQLRFRHGGSIVRFDVPPEPSPDS